MVAATMPPKGQTRQQSGTRLALIRHRAGMTQTEVARRIGVSIATYQRLEEGHVDNPPLGYLVNAAIVLNVALADVIEDEWLTWTHFGAELPAARRRRARWR